MRFTETEETAILVRAEVPKLLTSDRLADLRKRYSESARHYHNWQHALSVLAWVNHVCDAFPETTLFGRPPLSALAPYTHRDLRLAALFHDAIYDAAGSPSNEDRSAELLRAAAPSDAITRGDLRLVHATAHHGVLEAHECDLAMQLFLDCDMVSIAEPIWEVCAENNAAIEREYLQRFTAAEVNAGRKAFLEKLLAKRSVFLSDYFRVRHEVQARENIRRLVDQIGSR